MAVRHITGNNVCRRVVARAVALSFAESGLFFFVVIVAALLIDVVARGAAVTAAGVLRLVTRFVPVALRGAFFVRDITRDDMRLHAVARAIALFPFPMVGVFFGVVVVRALVRSFIARCAAVTAAGMLRLKVWLVPVGGSGALHVRNVTCNHVGAGIVARPFALFSFTMVGVFFLAVVVGALVRDLVARGSAVAAAGMLRLEVWFVPVGGGRALLVAYVTRDHVCGGVIARTVAHFAFAMVGFFLFVIVVRALVRDFVARGSTVAAAGVLGLVVRLVPVAGFGARFVRYVTRDHVCLGVVARAGACCLRLRRKGTEGEGRSEKEVLRNHWVFLKLI